MSEQQEPSPKGADADEDDCAECEDYDFWCEGCDCGFCLEHAIQHTVAECERFQKEAPPCVVPTTTPPTSSTWSRAAPASAEAVMSAAKREGHTAACAMDYSANGGFCTCATAETQCLKCGYESTWAAAVHHSCKPATAEEGPALSCSGGCGITAPQIPGHVGFRCATCVQKLCVDCREPKADVATRVFGKRATQYRLCDVCFMGREECGPNARMDGVTNVLDPMNTKYPERLPRPVMAHASQWPEEAEDA